MKFTQVFWAIAPVIGFTVFSSNPASAQLCYMRDNTGRLIDLSASVCGAGQSPSKTTTATNPKATSKGQDAFWQEFIKQLKDPTTRQTAELLGASTITDLAQSTCQALRSGQPLPDPKEQAASTRYPASFFESINTAATTTLCPTSQP